MCCVCVNGHLTGTDVAGLVRAGEPLAVAVDTIVIGAAFTHGAAGACG